MIYYVIVFRILSLGYIHDKLVNLSGHYKFV